MSKHLLVPGRIVGIFFRGFLLQPQDGAVVPLMDKPGVCQLSPSCDPTDRQTKYCRQRTTAREEKTRHRKTTDKRIADISFSLALRISPNQSISHFLLKFIFF
jgi:hypothetical protein